MAEFKIETEINLDTMVDDDDIKRAQKRLVTEVKEKSTPYIPVLTGRLRTQINVSKDTITYKAFNGGHKSYARKQYYTNRGKGMEGLLRGGKAGRRWTERMWEEQKDVICEEIKEELLGGK